MSMLLEGNHLGSIHKQYQHPSCAGAVHSFTDANRSKVGVVFKNFQNFSWVKKHWRVKLKVMIYGYVLTANNFYKHYMKL